MGCPFCDGKGKERAGGFRVALDRMPWGPRMRIERTWTDSDGHRRNSEALMSVRYCPMCGERLDEEGRAADVHETETSL